LKQLIRRTRLKFDHRRFLLDLMPKSSVCAEIGVHKGRFSAKILEIVHPRELHLIDPWRHESSAQYERALFGGTVDSGQQEMDARYQAVVDQFRASIDSGQVNVHRGYSSEVLAEFPDRYFDWIYIDGNHLYEFVMQDLQLALIKSKTGGYITGDDYGRKGWWEGGVERAVDEFCRSQPVELIEIRNNQFILKIQSTGSTGEL